MLLKNPTLELTHGPRQANLVLIAYASSEGSGLNIKKPKQSHIAIFPDFLWILQKKKKKNIYIYIYIY